MNPVLVALVADDEVDLLQRLCADGGWQLRTYADVASLAAGEVDQQADVALISLDAPSEGAMQLLQEGALEDVDDVLLMGAQEHDGLLDEWMPHGVTLFIGKPADEAFLAEVLAEMRAERVDSDSAEVAAPPPLNQFGLLRGNARSMKKLFLTLRKLAASDASVLATGESGTGKELLARSLHTCGPRAQGPFVAVNCGAIPSELIESELFGHEKGSFSGATRQHTGFFERASGGTLFLDELTEMPLEAQVKLLRVLETGSILRVGGEDEIKVDVRIVAACNRDIATVLDEGRLREDLYYRIAHFTVRLPPLRERAGDIVPLAFLFLSEINEEQGTQLGLSAAAAEALEGHDWPGNVRELRSVIERASIVANDAIEVDDLPAMDNHVIDDGEYLRVSVGTSLASSERRLIMATLEANDADKKRTAEVLGISLKTLYNRLNQYAEEDAAAEADATAEGA